MNAFNRPTPWASADHVAGQKPTDKDPFPGAQLKGMKLVDGDGVTTIMEFEPGEKTTAEKFQIETAKRIAAAVLNQVSAW